MARSGELLELRAKTTASLRWGRQFHPKHLGGINYDAVCELSTRHLIILEITEEKNLEKIRGDILRIALTRTKLTSEGIYVEGYCVTGFDPTLSMVETGEAQKVPVLSIQNFERELVDFESYRSARSKHSFGSAVNPLDGKIDNSQYISVRYMSDSNDPVGVDEISKQLIEGKRLILLGEYGTGKSRCFREVFNEMMDRYPASGVLPICINLRDCWGLRTAEELVRRHFDTIGLATFSDIAVRQITAGRVAYLLDGFDEIGAQTWSDNPSRLKDIRTKSLRAIADLVSKTPSGVIVSGREHYFNSHEELVFDLGFRNQTHEVLRCKDEFSHAEIEVFLKTISETSELPTWLPRRPLVCRTIAAMEKAQVDLLLRTESSEIEFWRIYIDVICNRESLISAGYDPESIKQVLTSLAVLTRQKANNVGPISVIEINQAFTKVRGFPPVDDTATILQRLPALGRIEAESSDRNFIDITILDCLRAYHCIGSVHAVDSEVAALTGWQNPLEETGLRTVATEIIDTGDAKPFHQYAKRCSEMGNTTLAGDIVASILQVEATDVDFRDMSIEGAFISTLDLSSAAVRNLHIHASAIAKLQVSAIEHKSVHLSNCIVSKIEGISGDASIPMWITNADIGEFDSVSTVKQIKKSSLSPALIVLTTVLKKLFFQPGRGRKEDALLRGLGQMDQGNSIQLIINALVREGIVDRFKGDSGIVYTPVRKHTERVKRMLSDLTQSKDPLWLEIHTRTSD